MSDCKWNPDERKCPVCYARFTEHASGVPLDAQVEVFEPSYCVTPHDDDETCDIYKH